MAQFNCREAQLTLGSAGRRTEPFNSLSTKDTDRNRGAADGVPARQSSQLARKHAQGLTIGMAGGDPVASSRYRTRELPPGGSDARFVMSAIGRTGGTNRSCESDNDGKRHKTANYAFVKSHAEKKQSTQRARWREGGKVEKKEKESTTKWVSVWRAREAEGKQKLGRCRRPGENLPASGSTKVGKPSPAQHRQGSAQQRSTKFASASRAAARTLTKRTG